MIDLIESMKIAALSAVESTKPCDIKFGTVVSESPLKIDIEQKLTLEMKQLILSRNVTEHEIEVTVEHLTELETEHTHAVTDTFTGGGSSLATEHLHEYKGRKKFLIHKGLKVGEQVILIRVKGGQKFVVMYRIGVMD